MTKKFIQDEWHNIFAKFFDLRNNIQESMMHQDLLDLFQSFEDRIESNANAIQYQAQTSVIASQCISKIINNLIKLEEKMFELLENGIAGMSAGNQEYNEKTPAELLKVGWVYETNSGRPYLILRYNKEQKREYRVCGIDLFTCEMYHFTPLGIINQDEGHSEDIILSTGKSWKPEE